MLFTIEYDTGRSRKLPSDSSASTIHQSLFPNLAEFPSELSTPPLITVGSILVELKIEDINDVVVVLPCEPDTTIFFLKIQYVLTFLLF